MEKGGEGQVSRGFVEQEATKKRVRSCWLSFWCARWQTAVWAANKAAAGGCCGPPLVTVPSGSLLVAPHLEAVPPHFCKEVLLPPVFAQMALSQ